MNSLLSSHIYEISYYYIYTTYHHQYQVRVFSIVLVPGKFGNSITTDEHIHLGTDLKCMPNYVFICFEI